ncbi:hypothetical protein [Argonema antarcticum]|nr:hypothetical protein [Argonema antarcticum]
MMFNRDSIEQTVLLQVKSNQSIAYKHFWSPFRYTEEATHGG